MLPERACSWSAGCPHVPVARAVSPYQRQLEVSAVDVCAEHSRVAVAAGWDLDREVAPA